MRAWANLYPWDVNGDPAADRIAALGLTGVTAAVRAAGAAELRLYHAGLAAAPDLAAIGALCTTGA